MATHLDFEEQEQLDQLKAFWQKYGTLIVWTLVLVLAAFGGWNLWQNHRRDEAVKAGVLYDELDKAAQAGDIEKVGRVFADMKARFAQTAYAQQSGLLTAKLQFEKGQVDPAVATLNWVATSAVDDAYKSLARLRLAGVLFDQKKYDEALKQLEPVMATQEFAALASDRRGDVLSALGKVAEARAAYQQAVTAMDPALEYRSLVDAKLTALGGPIDTKAVGNMSPEKSTAASGPTIVNAP